ncbi:MAG: tetratricopeptide repeat protein [Cyclobacteriaceae bacterium]|nr:tetratricopeptide repeat protein [Cyclobacteriaceae bacterium]
MIVKRIVFSLFVLWYQGSYGQEVETINRYRQVRLAEEYYEKGLHCYENDQIPEAIEHLNTSASLDPNNYLAYFFLGSSYEKFPDQEKALLNYNICLALKPDFSEGLFSRAVLHERSGNFKQAIQDFKRLLVIPTGETQAIYFKGIGYGEKDSEPGFDQFLTMSNRETDIHNSLGQCYSRLNKYDSAIYHFSEATRLNPEGDFYYVNRGLAYLEWGKPDSARIDFQKALSINPDNSLAIYNLNLLDPDNTAESLSRINRVIEKNPRLPFAYASRAFYYYREGKYELAKLDYDMAILLDKNNSSYYLNRGMCLEKMNELQETFRDYMTASNLDPGNPKVWYNLGNVFYKQEQFPDAIKAYTTAIQIDPEKGSCYYNRGLAYFQMGEKVQACKDMEQAYSRQVDPARTFLEKNCHVKEN